MTGIERNLLARSVLMACSVALLAGCVMPASTASIKDMQASAADGKIELVMVDPSQVPLEPPPDAQGFPPQFRDALQVDADQLGPGDVLRLRIFEAGVPQVFGPMGELGELAIDDSGTIFVPHVGTVRADGLTVSALRASIVARLRTVIHDPQVTVTLVESRSRLVNVLGTATKPGVYPIERGRTRLSALIGEAAQAFDKPDMLRVTMRRNGDQASVRMSDILADPALDIALRPGDTVVLDRLDENVTVIGAASVQGTVPIVRRDFSVIDALGGAQGLDNDAANPKAVFLVRAQPAGQAPLVYQFEMDRPEIVALASRFAVRDKDTVLISNANFTDVRKVLQAVAQSMSTVRNAVIIGQ
ncbi:MAG: polysaccharide biosynthesis/export family protein [Caenibius sp.]